MAEKDKDKKDTSRPKEFKDMTPEEKARSAGATFGGLTGKAYEALTNRKDYHARTLNPEDYE